MLDWWWANMEKGYYLWAPGSHKRFSWVREPWKYGFVHSAHMISESVGKDAPVFGGSGVQIDRLDLSWFPFTTHLEHVICEGIFNGKGEFVDATTICGRTAPAAASIWTRRWPIRALPSRRRSCWRCWPRTRTAGRCPPRPPTTASTRRPAGRVFLPKLYELWKDHPDPSQSVPCDLRVTERPDGTLEYIGENGPVCGA